MNRIALTNLGKYNEGSLIYKWLDLPFTNEELENALNEIGINEEYEEYFISDYETDFDYKIGEYENVSELNELYKKIREYSERDGDFFLIINAYIYHMNNDIGEALSVYEEGSYRLYYECNSMKDVASLIIDESGILEKCEDDLLSRYFDFEAYGRDIEVNGNFYYIGNDIYIEIF